MPFYLARRLLRAPIVGHAPAAHRDVVGRVLGHRRHDRRVGWPPGEHRARGAVLRRREASRGSHARLRGRGPIPAALSKPDGAAPAPAPRSWRRARRRLRGADAGRQGRALAHPGDAPGVAGAPSGPAAARRARLAVGRPGSRGVPRRARRTRSTPSGRASFTSTASRRRKGVDLRGLRRLRHVLDHRLVRSDVSRGMAVRSARDRRPRSGHRVRDRATESTACSRRRGARRPSPTPSSPCSPTRAGAPRWAPPDAPRRSPASPGTA